MVDSAAAASCILRFLGAYGEGVCRVNQCLMTAREICAPPWVESLVTKGAIVSRQVGEAFASVPRHLFVPDVDLDAAYKRGCVTMCETCIACVLG